MEGATRIQELEAKIEELYELLRQANARIAELEEENQKLRRRSRRSAAPHSRDDDKKKERAKRKKPGRKPGHKGESKPKPKPESVDREVEAPLQQCPECACENLRDSKPLEQYVIELPRKPVITRIVTHSAYCPCCGKRVRSTHPEQVSQATGAGGVHLGASAMAAAVHLHRGLGLTTRKTCEILEQLTGIELSPGGLIAGEYRLTKTLRKSFERLLQELRTSSVVYVDETGWWLDSERRWLWVFTNAQTTIYKVDARRNDMVVYEVLGDGFKGAFVSDSLNIYTQIYDLQQSCFAHHLRAVCAALELRPQSAFLELVKSVLKTGILVDELGSELPAEIQQGYRDRFDALFNETDTSTLDAVELGIYNRLAKRRETLTTFVGRDDVSATNNLAERELRPAVITRKLSAGHRSRQGADSWEVLGSLTRTVMRRGGDAIDFLAEAVRGTPPELPAPAH